MYKKLLQIPLAIVTALLLFATPQTFAADTKPVDVLMIGHYVPRAGEASWEKYQAACAKEGVRLHIYDKSQTLDYSLVTDDYLRQFHVVLFSGLPGSPPGNVDEHTEAAAAFRERLDAYYKAGGGVLWAPQAFQHGGTYWNDLVGDRYDVQSLEEKIDDPGKTIDANAPLKKRDMLKYIWTTNVEPHPVTDQVKGLFLPFLGEWSWPGTVPMKFGPSWTTLIKGMDSTRTMGNASPAGSGIRDFKPEVKGTYDAAPEFVGVREGRDGAGRMMVFPFHGTHTYLNYGHEAFKDAMMLNGHAGWPSDAHRLLLNAYKWLAEPAKAAGLGGHKPKPPVTAAIPEPLDWSQADFPPNAWGALRTFWNQKTQSDYPMGDLTGRDFRGVIGARTVASDGQGTVADYVKAAKELGLSFIVFLETLEKTDEARFAKLVADCAAASDETFAAIPGYLFRDQTGLLYYLYGIDKLPIAANLTDDRRVKVPQALVDQFNWRGNLGIAEFGKMKLDPNYLFLLTCAAPYVYEGGKRVDDGLNGYLSVEGRGHEYAPNALVQVTSPAAMREALAAGAMETVLHAENLADGLKCLSRSATKHPIPVYITSGPTITRWGALNPLGHPFFAGKQRVRFALKATSDVGLADVKIINANTGETVRHFKPNGAKDFSCAIDETHKRQWSLVPIITDVKGRSALGGTLQTFQDGNRLWMMGDRLMGMHHAHTWDPTRKKLVMEAGWLNLPWIKNYANFPGGPTSALKQPRAGGGDVKITGTVVGIDGGNATSEGHVNFYIGPAVESDLGREPKVQAYCYKDKLASFDVAVMDYDGSRQFTEKKGTGHAGGWPPNPDPQIPMELADIQVRTIAGRPSPEATVSSKIHEITYTFKKDQTLKRLPLFSNAWQYQHDNLMALFLRDMDGDFAWLLEPKSRFRRKGEMPAGGYFYPSNKYGGQIGVINLGDEPIAYSFGYPHVQVFIDGKNRKVKAGDKIVTRFLTFVGPKGDGKTSSEWLQEFIADFGVGVDRPDYPFTVKQGTLLSGNYMLELQAENGGATVEFGKYPLAHSLITAVNGMPANAVAGRYDLDRKQLLILPVFEGKALTTINLPRWENSLYIGELFRCDNPDVVLSCVQDGADKLLLEVHNPTDQPQTVKLAAVPGFAPLAGLDESLELAPFSSTKLDLPTPAGTLVNKPYLGD